MLIRAGDRPELESPDDDLVLRALLRGDDGAGLSLTHVRLSGAHRPLRTSRSARVYYVVEGSADFRIGNAEPVVAGPGDVVVIPRGERYSLEGKLTYLVLNAPPYVDGDDVYEDA